jgi:hypothetical protein
LEQSYTLLESGCRQKHQTRAVSGMANQSHLDDPHHWRSRGPPLAVAPVRTPSYETCCWAVTTRGNVDNDTHRSIRRSYPSYFRRHRRGSESTPRQLWGVAGHRTVAKRRWHGHDRLGAADGFFRPYQPTGRRRSKRPAVNPAQGSGEWRRAECCVPQPRSLSKQSPRATRRLLCFGATLQMGALQRSLRRFLFRASM